MQRSLRQYQSQEIQAGRVEISKGFRCVMFQLVTGGGKTRMVANITNNAISEYIVYYDSEGQQHKKQKPNNKKDTVWFVVPRKELLWQSSQEFNAWGIKHGIISAKSNESAAFQVHIVSKDTLVRRIKSRKIKNWPSIIIFDEAHLALKQQLFVKESAPENTMFLGWTATPERLDGLGLNEMYQSIIYGPSLGWMVENGGYHYENGVKKFVKYLKRPKIYSVPPIQGLKDLKFNRAGEVNAKALTELYKARAEGGKTIYGNEIEHYRKYGIGRAALVFCRSIIDAELIAGEFTTAGFKAESIDGTMTDRVRQDKINRVKNKELDVLTTVDLVTYGLDVPKISCIIMLRPTDSVSLFFQMIGRGLRPDPDFSDCLIFDHVGNCDEKKHGHPLAPRVWNFEGAQKRKKPKDAIERLESVDKCPVCWDLIIEQKQCVECKRVYLDGICPGCDNRLYNVVMACRTCGALKEVNHRKDLQQIDGWLVPIDEPMKLNERPLENRREYEDLINSCREKFREDWESSGTINESAVKNLLDAAKDLRRQSLWVYHFLNDPDLSVNFSLLAEIERIKEYKRGWAYYKRKELERSA
jgi:superfamily II DNA or RNA helicase